MVKVGDTVVFRESRYTSRLGVVGRQCIVVRTGTDEDPIRVHLAIGDGRFYHPYAREVRIVSPLEQLAEVAE